MKRSTLLLAAALPVLAGVAPSSAQASQARLAAARGTLTGVITDATTHKPMAHVLLTLGYLAKGYYYFHGETAIRAGGTTTYSHIMGRDTSPQAHPTIVSYYATPGTPARFGMRANKGNDAFSFEMMAISPDLGRLVVLQHGPGNRYDGTLALPAGIKGGTYTFYFVATQNNCFTNKTFPSKRVTL